MQHVAETDLLDRNAAEEPAERIPPSLAIVDDSRLRRDCLKLALAQQARRWRLSEAASASELDAPGDFDAILFGASNCARVDLAEVARLAAMAPLLVCADCDEPEHMRAILRAGARGFVPASLGLGVLLAALERVRAGGAYVPAILRAAPPARAPRADVADEVWGELTRRQREVLALISEGKSNRLIADALTMSEDTVKAHVKQIIKRLNVANRTQAALLAAGAKTPAARWEVARR